MVDLTGTQESDINRVDPWFEGTYDEDYQKKNIELQDRYVPSIAENLNTNDKDSSLVDLTGTQESDINRVDPWFEGTYDEDYQKKNIELQDRYVPSIAENLNTNDKDSSLVDLTGTQESDINRVDPWFEGTYDEDYQKKNIELQKNIFLVLQKI